MPTSTNKVAIIALSARPYVQLAKLAGWQVLAVDVFADRDTQKYAEDYLQWPSLASLTDAQSNQVKVDALLTRLTDCAVTHIVYGAGFEHAPTILNYFSQQARALNLVWLGNVSDTVAEVKNPRQLAQACLSLGLRFPQTSMLPLVSITQIAHEQWLVKRVGACGGNHIQLFTASHQHAENDYYQVLETGQAVGALCIGDGVNAFVIGAHQLFQRPNSYAYAGAIEFDDKVLMQSMIEAVSKLVKQFKLVGINSLDAIWQNGVLTVLEINPRLSASASLYASASLFEAHVATCLGEPVTEYHALAWSVKAQPNLAVKTGYAIIYAKQDLTLPVVEYPDWVADVPNTIAIKANMPICSVYAEGTQHLDVIKQLKIRIQLLKQNWGVHVSQYIETSFD